MDDGGTPGAMIDIFKYRGYRKIWEENEYALFVVNN
jgi:hypothetical protein